MGELFSGNALVLNINITWEDVVNVLLIGDFHNTIHSKYFIFCCLFFSAGFVFVAFFMYSNFIWSKCAYFKCLAIPSQTYLNCNSLRVQCFKLRLLGVFMRNMTSHVIGSLCGREYLCTTPTNYTVINMHSSFIVINVDELTE